MVDPGKVEKEVGVMAIELSAVSFRLQQILLVAVEVFEYCCCSVLFFSRRSDKFLSSWCQRVMVPPEVVGVRE